MTTPNTNIQVVDAQGTPKNVPAFSLPSGAVAAAYVEADPATGHGGNMLHASGENYARLVAAGATLYIPSNLNVTSANLNAGASFTGSWEAIPSQCYVSINAFSTQPIRLVIEQAQDAVGDRKLPPITFIFQAGFNQLIPVNGNFVRISATNLGGAATTTLVIDSQFTSGGLPTTDKGAVAVGVTEPMGIMREAITDTLFVGRSSATPNAGSVLNSATRSTYLATEGAIVIRNTNAAGGADIRVRKLQLICTGAGTGLTSPDMLFTVDTQNRYSSLGNVMTMAGLRSRRAPNAIVNFGTVTLTAESGGTALQVGRARLKTAAPVIGDVFKVAFGSEPTTEFGAISGTAAGIFGHSAPPMIIPPGGTGIMYLWSAGQTAAPAFEVQLLLAEG